MSITPADIQQQRFSEARKGYDPGEVDVFLETLAAEVDAMLRKIADLKGRLNNAEKQLASAQAQLAQKPAAQPALPQASNYGATERQISAALITAQQSADRIVNDAQADASRIREEAEGKAREVIRQALERKKGELEEIERLKESREEFRASYMKLLQRFMDDANSVFPQAMLTTSAPSGSEAPAMPAPRPAAAPAPKPAPAADATVFAPAANPFGAKSADVDMEDLD